MATEDKKGVNQSGWLWLAPQYLDQWRIWPRMFIVFYFWLCMQTAMWFMDLPDPTNAQAGFAGAVISAGAAWFGLYVNSGPRPIQQPPHFVTEPLPEPPRRRPTRRTEPEDIYLDDEPKG
jgi:hypothetical protein